MKLRSTSGSCSCAVPRATPRRARQAVEVGRQVEVVAHLQLAVVAGVVDALRPPAPQRRGQRARQVVGVDVVGVDVVLGAQHRRALAAAVRAACRRHGRAHRCRGCAARWPRAPVPRPKKRTCRSASTRRCARGVCGAHGPRLAHARAAAVAVHAAGGGVHQRARRRAQAQRAQQRLRAQVAPPAAPRLAPAGGARCTTRWAMPASRAQRGRRVEVALQRRDAARAQLRHARGRGGQRQHAHAARQAARQRAGRRRRSRRPAPARGGNGWARRRGGSGLRAKSGGRTRPTRARGYPKHDRRHGTRRPLPDHRAAQRPRLQRRGGRSHPRRRHPPGHRHALRLQGRRLRLLQVQEARRHRGARPAPEQGPVRRGRSRRAWCSPAARVPQTDVVLESRQVTDESAFPVRKMPSRVTSLEKVSHDVMVVKLQLPANDTLRYHAGQYIEFILRDGARRSYSMANAPHNGPGVELHIRHMPGGKFTDHVFTAMKEKEILRVEGPVRQLLPARGLGQADDPARVGHRLRADQGADGAHAVQGHRARRPRCTGAAAGRPTCTWTPGCGSGWRTCPT